MDGVVIEQHHEIALAGLDRVSKATLTARTSHSDSAVHSSPDERAPAVDLSKQTLYSDVQRGAAALLQMHLSTGQTAVSSGICMDQDGTSTQDPIPFLEAENPISGGAHNALNEDDWCQAAIVSSGGLDHPRDIPTYPHLRTLSELQHDYDTSHAFMDIGAMDCAKWGEPFVPALPTLSDSSGRLGLSTPPSSCCKPPEQQPWYNTCCSRNEPTNTTSSWPMDQSELVAAATLSSRPQFAAIYVPTMFPQQPSPLFGSLKSETSELPNCYWRMTVCEAGWQGGKT